MNSAAMNGAMIRALIKCIRDPATLKEWQVTARRAGITTMLSRASSTSSTPRIGMAIAWAATLDGNGMTAIKRGGRKTALKITTLRLGDYTAGGSGMSRAKVTTGVPTIAKVTTGSLKPIILTSAPTTSDEQYYFATVHLAAERTCASYLA